MGGLYANLLAILTSLFVKAETVLVQAFSTIVLELPGDESKILHDSLAVVSADLKAGKGVGEATADAFTVFYNEEKGEVSKVTKQLFLALVAALEASSPK